MELQFHPASGRRTVRTLAAGPRAEWARAALAAATAALGASLWITVPALAARWTRQEERGRVAGETRLRAEERARTVGLAVALRARALAQGNLLNRIGFLYGVTPAVWPRVLNPQRQWLSSTSPEALVGRLPAYGRALERARQLLADRDRADESLAAAVPSIVPLEAGPFEPAARFGPRVSPWTGEEEFFPGVDLAASAGSAVLSSGAGTVAFTGYVRRNPGGWLWRLGNVVVVSHGPAGATVYGHLGRVDVRRGQRLARGDRIGTVGMSGWALSPQLHYEFWRPERDGLRPTDPLFAALDHLPVRPFSLEQMLATSAPSPLEALPGIQVAAEKARGSAEPRSVRRSHRTRRRT